MLFMTNPNESGRGPRAGGTAALLVLAAAFLTGCPDPQAEFDDFEARYEETKPPPVVAACGETVQSVEGDFLFALSAQIDAEKPILFLASIVTEADGMHVSVTPLEAADRKTLIPPPLEIGPYPIDAEGNFVAALPQLTIPGAANPITGSEIVATTTLSGAVCENLLCGDVTGQVTEPLMLDLAGSTFAMARVMGTDYPEPPVIDCSGKTAEPL